MRHVVVDGYGVVYASSSRDRVVFASRPPDSVMCPACKDVLRKPRRAPCGHAFCASCAEECVKSTGTCLQCKMVVPADSWIPDETLMLEISNLRAHCPHAWRRAASGTSTLDHRGFGHRSCGMIVRYEDLKSHAQVCDFKTVICGLVEKERDVDMPSRCDVECVARDLEAHRRECAYRVWPCPNEGCDWTGSAMHAASHAETCAFKPVVCAHGCGATLRSASVVERHEEICPAKEVVCGLVDENDPDERTRCCPAKMRRHALATHREKMCDYVTASECSDCLKPVARRSATRHKQLCPMAQRKCVCGVMIAASKLQEHIDSQCPKQDVLCDFHEVGCVVRCPRSMMERHYAEASAAHLKLLLKASLEVREVSETMARDVEKVVRDDEGMNESDRLARDGVLKAIRLEETRALEDIKTLRENEVDARKRGTLYAESLRKALIDQAETYDAAISEMQAEIERVKDEFETYKKRSSFELAELRTAVEAAEIAVSEVSARASVVTRGGGIFDEHKRSIEEHIEREREMTLDEIEKATRNIQFEIEDANAEQARQIVSLREDIRTVLNSRIR